MIEADPPRRTITRTRHRAGATRTYQLHGIRVCSEIPLDAAPAPEGEAELTIRLGRRRPIPDAVPVGRLLAGFRTPGKSSSLTRTGTGYTLRVHTLCDFEMDERVATVEVHLAPDTDDEFAALLIGGVLAAALVLRDACVLHASAIALGSSAVAFIGPSGSGKTTVAGLCCVAGARLVTDDVLRVQPDHAGAWCFRGSTALRLRPAVAALANGLGSDPGVATFDGRAHVDLPPVERSRLPLGAIVTPVPSRDIRQLRLERLRGSEAVLELLRYPRTTGWNDPAKARRDLAVLASLARTIPVARALIPWQMPFQPELGRVLLGELKSLAAS